MDQVLFQINCVSRQSLYRAWLERPGGAGVPLVASDMAIYPRGDFQLRGFAHGREPVPGGACSRGVRRPGGSEEQGLTEPGKPIAQFTRGEEHVILDGSVRQVSVLKVSLSDIIGTHFVVVHRKRKRCSESSNWEP